MQPLRQLFRLAGHGLGLGALMAWSSGVALGHGTMPAAPTPLSALTTWTLDPLPLTGVLLAAAAYLIAVRRVNGGHPRVPVPAGGSRPGWAASRPSSSRLIPRSTCYAGDLLSSTWSSTCCSRWWHRRSSRLAPGHAPAARCELRTPPAPDPAGAPLQGRPPGRFAARRVAGLRGRDVAHPLQPAVRRGARGSPRCTSAEHLVYLAAGALFWWPVVAADPMPRRLGYRARLAYVALQMPVNAAVGLAIYFAPTVLYAHYATIARSWGPDALTDQQIGGRADVGRGRPPPARRRARGRCGMDGGRRAAQPTVRCPIVGGSGRRGRRRREDPAPVS